MGRDGVLRDCGLDRGTVAQEAPQHGVHQRHRPRLAERPRGLGSLRHGGVGRDPHLDELIETDEEQCADVGVPRLERLGSESREQGIEAVVPAAGAVAELGEQGAVGGADRGRRYDVRERAPGEHPGDHAGRCRTRVLEATLGASQAPPRRRGGR